MRRLIAITCALAIALTGLAADKATVKIGVILPLTGNNALIGQLGMRAVDLFNRELESGGYKHKYQLIIEDDQLTPRLTAEAANKLINIDKVDAIVSWGSGPGNVLSPRSTKVGIPLMSCASDIKIANGRTSFIHWPPPTDEAPLLMEMLKKMKTKKIALLTMRHQWGLATQKAIQAEVKKNGLQIIFDENFNAGERDFRVILTKAREAKPDVFVPIAFSPEIEIILRQAKQVWVGGRIASIEAFDFISEPGIADGLFYVSGSLGTPEFKTRIKALIGKDSGFTVPHSYDSLALLRDAFEQKDTIDRPAACRWLSRVKDYRSAVGTISVDAQGIFHSPVAVFKILNGHPTPATLDEVK